LFNISGIEVNSYVLTQNDNLWNSNAEQWNFMLDPGLYVVATPIGNLEDISYRAVRILGEADLVAAEDTRHSKILLDHYGITTSMQSLHDHNEPERIAGLVALVRKGKAVALVSDAGTPLISDPGFKLVRAMREESLPVFTVPGPSAVTAALSIAGLSTERFRFEGFLPAKPAARRKLLASLVNCNLTMVFFESGHRIEACLPDLIDAFGAERQVAVCRELTKRFETVLSGSLEDINRRFIEDKNQRKGEFVVVVSGNPQPASRADGLELAKALQAHLSSSQAARVAAEISGTPRQQIYKALQNL
jgi:16S rRNA (cytidine1402-2'-O)-methyltransferase